MHQITLPGCLWICAIDQSEYCWDRHCAVWSKHEKKNITVTIQDDIWRIFSIHQVDKIIARAKSIVYFLDDHFYVSGHLGDSSTKRTTSRVDVDRRKSAIPPNNNHNIALVLEHLLLITSSNDVNQEKTTPSWNLEYFNDRVIAQSVYGLRSCSLESNQAAQRDPQCLVQLLYNAPCIL